MLGNTIQSENKFFYLIVVGLKTLSCCLKEKSNLGTNKNRRLIEDFFFQVSCFYVNCSFEHDVKKLFCCCVRKLYIDDTMSILGENN